MTPKELKSSILQLAIQGKLVEQRPEEGTAEELYKQIQEEKQRLIAEKKIKKEKPLPEITEDEKPFDIPDNWKWVRLGSIVDYSIGKTPPRAETQWWGSGIPWVSISDMQENGYVNETKEFITKDALTQKFNNKLSLAGTLIMSFKLTVGRVSILDIDAVHNEAIISIYPYADKKCYIKKYLFSILPYISQYGDSKNAIKGKTLNTTSLNNLLLPLPPLAEQKRIVEKLEQILPHIDQYEKAWNKLEKLNKRFPDDMKKSLLQYAIQGKLVEQRPEEGTAEELYKQIQEEKQRLIAEKKIKKEKSLPEITEDEKPFDIPDNWKWVRLGEIFQHNTGKALNSTNKEGINLQYITTSNLYWNRFELDNIKEMFFTKSEVEKFTVKKGDLLVCEGGDVGRAAIWKNDYDIRIQNHIHRLRAYYNVSTEFFYYLFYLYKSAGWIGGKGIGIKGLSSKAIHVIIFPLPPLAEQKRIVEKLEQLLPLCERLK